MKRFLMILASIVLGLGMCCFSVLFFLSFISVAVKMIALFLFFLGVWLPVMTWEFAGRR